MIGRARPRQASGHFEITPSEDTIIVMESKEFSRCRRKLNKTQKQMAQLLGTSLKAIHSYEQGWRSIPAHAERQLLFLMSKQLERRIPRKPCWEIKKCPIQMRSQCPAWEFNSGDYCWFISGTICECKDRTRWKDKIVLCRSCKAFGKLRQAIEQE
jgi:DNA-binding transcriptional regulator YiaG